MSLPDCDSLAAQLAELRAGLPALRDAVGQARRVAEKQEAAKELAAHERAVDAKQAEFDACIGLPPPPPPAVTALLGTTDILIDTRRDGSWTGALLHETLGRYTLTFSGRDRTAVAITSSPPPVRVGGGLISGGPFGIVPGVYFNFATRRGGAFGMFDAGNGRLNVPLFIDFVEGARFRRILWGAFDYSEFSQAGWLAMSTDTSLPDPLVNSFPSGARIAADGNVTVAGIDTVRGGRNDRCQIAVTIDGRFVPWPPITPT
jgi:hypothetical protein